MPKSLIIVESPAKTKTIKGFLGKDFAVEASMGHVMDLPKKDAAVDIEHDFRPTYEVMKDRKDVVAKLKAAAKSADMVYLASDPDREGEAISAHIREALGLEPGKYRRIQFNALTRSAVEDGLRNPRDLDDDLYNAQQARRVLDRLVGFKISPLLWRKVRPNLSAGRVQSVAVRLVCDREREIQAFVPVESWSVTANLSPQAGAEGRPFDARLDQEAGAKIELHNQADADRVLAALEGATWTVRSVKKSERKRSPYAPFETATLQQEAARKLGFSSRRTMTVAQQLYEGIDLGGEIGTVGLITYMRTDSTRIAPEAQAAAREHILRHYGERYLPAKPPVYKSKGAAQEAHEAIRPTEVDFTPASVKARLSADQAKLYDLIWKRFLSSQMAQAIFDAVSVDIAAASFVFRASGSTLRFDGFLSIYNEGKDNPDQVDEDEKPPLPPLTESQLLDLLQLTPRQHFSEPPPRYTEATMVKTLKEREIGRPSTYATILSTIVARQYVELKERKFHPTDLGFAVTDLLVEAFPQIMDVQFTADMERHLDEVEEGRRDWVALMHEFWSGFSESIKDAETKDFQKKTGETCPDCGGELVEKFGRYGKFHSCSNYPECKYIKRDKPAASDAEPVVSEITCPNCGRNLVEKSGRFGKFLGCPGYPDCKYIHKEAPKTTGKSCPECGKGQIVEKRSRTGVFYGCDNYPKCKLTLSGQPLDRACPKCGGLLFEKAFRGRVSGIACANSKKGCDYSEKLGSEPDSGGD